MRSGEAAAEFGHFFMGLEEARAGRGVAIVPSVVLPDLEYRRKLKALDAWPPIASAGEYYVLTTRMRANDAAIASFISWIVGEASKHRRRLRLVR